MQGVEVFSVGVRKGKPYTTRDLDDMVANFKRFQQGPAKLQKAPVVVGHTQKDVHNSAVAKHGDVCRLYREGDKLKLDTSPLDEPLVEAIKAQNYDDVSAEIYDEPPEEFKRLGAKGKMFRRLAILGGDIPYVKGLNPLGLASTLATFGESPTIKITRLTRRGAAYQTFSEDVPMTRDEQIFALVTAGGNEDVLETFSDEQLAEAFKIKGEATPAPAPSSVAVTFSEEQLAGIVAQVAEKIAGPLNGAIAEKLAASEIELKRQRIDVFCETELRAGRIDPADMDRETGPNLADRLMQLDDTEKVHTFTEGGTQKKLSSLDAEMRAIRLRTPRDYGTGRKIRSGNAGPATFAESAAAVTKERFQAFAEANAEEYEKAGQTVQEVVEAWETAKPSVRRELEEALGFTG